MNLKMTVQWKSTKHKADLFLHVKGLLYKPVTDSNKKFLALAYLKHGNVQCWWKHMINFVTRGATQTYCVIKCQYYWKGINKDIRKCIAQCALCHREKAKVQAYHLQMTEIPE